MSGARQFDELRWRVVAGIGLTAVFLAATGAGAQTSGHRSQPPPADKSSSAGAPSIVAWIDSTPVYNRDVQRGIAELTRGKKIGADKLPSLQATVLQDLIDQKMLSNFIEKSPLRASSDEIDAGLADFSKKLQQQNQSLNGYLEKNRISESVLRKQVSQELTLQKYILQNTTDDALQQYFHDHRGEFDGTERRVSHIVLRPLGVIDDAALKALMAQAQQLRGRIVVGDISFDLAATRYSEGPSRHHGGDMGYIPRQGVASDQFSEAAFALHPREISQPVIDSFGVHLINVTDLKAGQKTWQDVREPLKGAYSRVLMLKLMNDLRAQSRIEFADSFPHFIPGTRELAPPPPVGTGP